MFFPELLGSALSSLSFVGGSVGGGSLAGIIVDQAGKGSEGGRYLAYMPNSIPTGLTVQCYSSNLVSKRGIPLNSYAYLG
jgi:hypothetical protein